MNRNNAPWTVPNISSCGVRKNWRTVRLAFWSEAVTKWAPVVSSTTGDSAATSVVGLVTAVMGAPKGSGGVRRLGLGIAVGIGRFERPSGDGEEHLVERRTAKADVVDFDVAIVERAHDVAELICPAFDARGDALRVHVGVW